MTNISDDKHQSLDLLMHLAHGWKDSQSQNIMRHLLVAAEGKIMPAPGRTRKTEKVTKETCLA